MELTVNGAPAELADDATVADLVAARAPGHDRVAVARNGDVVPGVSELELVETLARWRPGTPDNAPLLGPGPLPGLVLATGHHRNGALLPPVTAEVIAELLATGTLPELAAPFTADRFGR